MRTKLLKSDRGDIVYMDALLVFFISILIFSILIGVVPVFMQKQKMDYVTREVLKEAEIRGNTDVEVEEYYDFLIGQIGLEPKSISFEGTKYIGSSKNIQINDPIILTIKSDFSFFSTWAGSGIDVELVSVMTGRSGVFYK